MNSRIAIVLSLLLTAPVCEAATPEALLTASSEGKWIHIELANIGEVPFEVSRRMSTIRGGGDVALRVYDGKTELINGLFQEGFNSAEGMKVILRYGQAVGIVVPVAELRHDYRLKTGCYTLFAEFRNLSMGKGSFPAYLKSNSVKFCVE